MGNRSPRLQFTAEERETPQLKQAIRTADKKAAKLEKAEAKINQYLDKAADLLDTPSLPRNGYYAFVCEKCAPTFDYYGFFLYANDLKERAREIYERP